MSGAEDRADGAGVGVGQALDLDAVERAGIDLDPALGSTERHVDHRGLPGHQRRQRSDLVDVGARVEPDAALVRAARRVVLDPVADEGRDRPVGASDRHLDAHLGGGHVQARQEVIGDADRASGPLEVVGHGVEGRHPRRTGPRPGRPRRAGASQNRRSPGAYGGVA